MHARCQLRSAVRKRPIALITVALTTGLCSTAAGAPTGHPLSLMGLLGGDMNRISRKFLLIMVVVVASVGAAVVAPGHPAAAVEGGKPVLNPWAVFIRNKESGASCTGSLISAQWVLTAAHCVITGAEGQLPVKDPTQDFTVIVDFHGINPTKFEISDIKLFDPDVPLGQCGVADVDLALMKLASRIPASSPLTPLAIVPPGASGTTGGTLPVMSPSPVDYGYGLTAGVVEPSEGCEIKFKDRVPAQTLNRTIAGDYSPVYPCQVPDDWCLEHSAGKSYSMPGDSGGPWVIPGATKIPGGGATQNLFEFGVESMGESCAVGGVCPNDAAVDLTNPAVNSWIANTAGTVLAPDGTTDGTCSPRCIVTSSINGTLQRWEVESDGFGHPIDDQTYECLAGQHVTELKPLTSFQLDEVPRDSLPATCLAGTSGAASWPELNYGPDRAGYQPDETTIEPGNAGSLSQARTYAGDTAPLIANGILYVVSTNRLYAYDATGATNCSAAPSSCTPLWSAPAANFDGMAIAGGVVFVTDAEGVQAYDAAGVTNCSGTPTVCTPLWATSTNEATGPGFTPGSGSPVVANGILYVPGYGDGIAPSAGGAYVAAFDASGSQGCEAYENFGTICVPMWTTTGLPASTGNSGSPAVANGVIYIANGALYAFSASGCSPAPTTGCPPIWTTATAGTTYSAPAVADGTVYVGTWNGPMYAYDAAGCGSASCSPLWTAVTGGTGGTPAVANGIVYTVSAGGTLSAFDAAGSTNCSGTATAKTCTPLWASAPGGSGYVTMSSPAVANGVVYFSSTNGGTYGYDAAGSLNCSLSSTAKTCAPLWGAVTGYIGGGSPAVVNGVVYINVPGDGEVYAYSLPTTGAKLRRQLTSGSSA